VPELLNCALKRQGWENGDRTRVIEAEPEALTVPPVISK
jgi:hypothetical protein